MSRHGPFGPPPLALVRRRRRRLPPWGSDDQYGSANILITESGEPILTEDGRVASGDDVALERERE